MDSILNYSLYKKWHRPFFLICIIITLAIVFLLLKINAATKGSEILTPIAKEVISPTPTFIKKKNRNQISIQYLNPRDGEKIEDKDAVLIDVKVESQNRISKIKIFADNALVKKCFVTNFCSHWWNTKDITQGNHIIRAEIQDSSSPQYIETKSIVVVK